MSTPSERIFAHREDDDGVELRHFPSAQARHPVTLTQTADQIADGTALREAGADFVDDLRWARDADDIAQRITERPRNLDPRTDAYLAALAEHFTAAQRGPHATVEQRTRPFSVPHLVVLLPRPVGTCAIVESPAAFRRRGILLGAGMLNRL
ncbi:MAG: hypothetical protein WCF33_05695 [Pseudonocardiaceae bacterium]